MLVIEFSIFNYVTGKSLRGRVTGYTVTVSGGAWVNYTAAIDTADPTMQLNVYFGSRGGKACFWIGEPSTVWQYPKLSVDKVTASHANYSVAQWSTGWNVALDTVAAANDGGGLFYGAVKTFAANVAFGENTYESIGGPLATTVNFKTALGNSSGVIGAGAGLFANSLGDLDGVANSKLGGIAAGATVGATWGDNLLSRPTWAVDGRAGAGLDAAGLLATNVPQAKGAGLNVAGVIGGGPFVFATTVDPYTQIANADVFSSLTWADTGTSVGAMVATGSTVRRIAAGAGWNATKITKESFKDAVRVSFRPYMLGRDVMIGLTDVGSILASSAEYAEIDFAIQATSSNVMGIYESGVNRGTFGAITLNSIMTIEYANGEVKYYLDGVLKRTVVTTKGRTFFVAVTGYQAGAGAAAINVQSGADAGKLDGIEPEADVTKNKQISFEPPANYNIQANSSGATTTSLPETRTVKLLQGGVLLASDVAYSMHSVPAGIAATVGASTGVVSLTSANTSGTLVVKAIYAGVSYFIPITVNRVQAAPIAGGDAGSTSFIDGTWQNISSTSDVQVTDVGAQVQSTASGQMSYSASAGFSGNGNATLTAQYSTDGSTWTNFAAATSGLPASPGEPGYVELSGLKTGLAASTDYYVRIVGRRTGGSGTLSWTGPNAAFMQP